MKRIFLSCAFLLSYTSICLSSPLKIELPTDGEVSFTLTPENPSAEIYTSSKLKDSSQVQLRVTSPEEVSIETSTRWARKAVSLKSASAFTTAWSNRAIEFRNIQGSLSSKLKASPLENINASVNGVIRDGNCGCLSEEEISYNLIQYGFAYPTRDALCSYILGELGPKDCNELVKQNGGQDSTQSTFFGIETRNACDTKGKQIVKLKITSNFDSAKYPSGLPIKLSYKSVNYEGKQYASLKPVSEGMWAPAPLLLYAIMGYGIGSDVSYLQVSKWNATGITKKINIKGGRPGIVYRGFFLTAYKAAPAISLGGDITVDQRIDGSMQAFGHCFKASRTRQNKGGYSL